MAADLTLPPLGRDFVEVVSPVREDAPAARYLARAGTDAAGYMDVRGGVDRADPGGDRGAGLADRRWARLLQLPLAGDRALDLAGTAIRYEAGSGGLTQIGLRVDEKIGPASVRLGRLLVTSTTGAEDA